MSSAEPDRQDCAVQDPGMQAERTRLAWSRTALATAALGALLTHGARSVSGLVCGLVVLGLAGFVLLCGITRYRDVRAAVAGGRSVVTGWVRVVLPAAVHLAPLAVVVALVAR